MPDTNFNFSVPIFKAEGDWRFSGRASTTGIDRHGERISVKAIDGFKQQLGVALCIGDDHRSVVTSIVSEVGLIDTVGGGSTEFDIEGPIFKEHPYGSYVYARLSNPDFPPNWKLSIGGKIPDGGKRMEWDSDAGLYVAIIDELLLDHVFLCRGNTAVNQETFISAKSEDWGDAVFKAASSIEIDMKQNEDLSSSHKAEDNLEADLMPDEVSPVTVAAEGDEKVSVGTLTSLIDVVKGLLVKSDEPVVEDVVVIEEAPVEKAEDAPTYVTLEQMTEAIDGLKSALIETLKGMVVEKTETVPDPEPVAEEEEKSEAVEEPEVVEGESVTVSKSEYDRFSEMLSKVEGIVSAAGGSAQLPVSSGDMGKADGDDGYPDVFGALTSHPVIGAAVARSLERVNRGR